MTAHAEMNFLHFSQLSGSVYKMLKKKLNSREQIINQIDVAISGFEKAYNCYHGNIKIFLH